MTAASRRLEAINRQDFPAARALADALGADQRRLAALAEFAGRADAVTGERYDPLGIDAGRVADPAGARTFADLLSTHPAFRRGRRLTVALPVVGSGDADPALMDVRRDAADTLLLGALAAASLDLGDRFMGRLIQVAVGADVFSSLLRPVLLGKPVPEFDSLSIPPWLLDLTKDIDRRTCIAGLQHALIDFGRAAKGSLRTSDVQGMTGITPHVGCDGTTVTIQGAGFGGSRPGGVDVYFPARSGKCKGSTVVTWSDTAITVLAPVGVGTGCVGFVRPPTGGGSLGEAAGTLAGEMERCIGMAASGAAFRLRQMSLVGHVMCPPCMPNGANHFTGGAPVINHFSVNGGSTVEVEPNATVTLSWFVQNAATLSMSRTSGPGPFPPPPAPLPLMGTHALGTITGTTPTTTTYRLVASNGCGTVERTVTVRLTKRPKLAIQAVEVVQAIQRADNSVSLVAGKRTAVRVFVESGMTGGFDLGAGPDVQPGVTGRITVFPVGGNQGFGSGAPWSPGTVAARPAATMNRDDPTHSLQFELPVALITGAVDLHVRVFVAGHENDIGGDYVASATTRVTFTASAAQEVLPFLIADPIWGLPAPTLAQFNNSLQGARSRYPISETGFVVNPPIAFATASFGRARDLTAALGWQLLLGELTTMIFLFPNTPVGGVRAGVVPRDPGTLTDPDGNQVNYALNGIAMPRVLLSIPSQLSQNGLQGTFAHELGHAIGIGHAPCPPPCAGCDCTPPAGIDARLPGGTDDTAMDVPARSVIEAGRGELMSYCGDTSQCPGATRWPSIATWNIILGSLPI